LVAKQNAGVHYFAISNSKQGKQCTYVYNVTLRRVCATTVGVQEQ